MAIPPKDQFTEILELLESALREGRPLDAAIDLLLRAARARAAGLWRLEGGELRLIGFRGVPDIPAEVKESFAEATLAVALDRTDLGIVKAAVTGRPSRR